MKIAPRPNGPDDRRNPGKEINRREILRRLMLAGGAGIVLPGVAEEQPGASFTADPPKAEGTGAHTSSANWTPQFFDAHQDETIAVLAEGIIPGSGKAQVNQFIDLLLSVDTQNAQKKFLASLSAFEAVAIRRFSHPYKDLNKTQQNQILTSASMPEHGDPAGSPERLTMCAHFEKIKVWVSDAYYSSEIGMKELGWNGQVYFTSLPGCPESEK